ncbi:polyketide synthase [Streptomyces sp. NPDC019990]|uniref:polyketide synthase n=1 Tax=Streptomyces sp. NPDC019990 TaxID=3154693 RepID=UPI0033D9E0FE
MTTFPYGPVELHTEAPVATVRLCDEAGSNRFTPELRAGLIAALRAAGADPAVRAVVLEGAPGVFSAGGTTERMLGTHEQRVVELWEMMRAIADCPVPVIAAVQGHALGGGLLLALYCDVAVLSERSRYAMNFLAFGFTSILGASHLVPAAFGRPLGTEMLYTSRSYTGRELRDRGAGVKITAPGSVAVEAHRMALQAAQAPRPALELMKSQLVRTLLADAEAALEREIPDHEETVRGEEARRRIRGLHGQRLAGPAGGRAGDGRGAAA